MAWLRLAPYLAILLAIVAALWYRGEAISANADKDRAKAELVRVEQALEQTQTALNQLTLQRALDASVISDLVDLSEKINEAAAELSSARSELELANDAVRDYLSAPVPPDLKRLYD